MRKLSVLICAGLCVSACAGTPKNTDRQAKQTPISKPCPAGYVETLAGQCEPTPAAQPRSERRRVLVPREPLAAPLPSLPPVSAPGVIR